MDTQIYCKLLEWLNVGLLERTTRTNDRVIDADQEKKVSRAQYLVELHRILATRLDNNGVRKLCSDLGVEYDNLPNGEHASRAKALIKHCERRNRIFDLVEIGKGLYPSVPWMDVPEMAGQASPVYECLCQSILACEESNEKQMLALAQGCLKVARECKDLIGEASALIHLGVAYAQMYQFDQAIRVCKRAKRIYHRNSDQWQQRGEGIAAYGLGLIFQCDSECLKSGQPKQIGNLRAKAIGYYHESLDLFEQTMRHYAAIGDKEQFLELRKMCQDIRQRAASQIPIVYVDGKKCKFIPVGRPPRTFLDLQDVDCQPTRIGEDIGQELGISPGDYILTFPPEQIEDAETSPEMDKDEQGINELRQDEQGRIRYGPPDSDESGAQYVGAILKPTD